jgi:hypothetical protein
MKAINNYINESKNFKLTESERDALSDFIGVICGNIGDDEDQNELKDVIDKLNDDEISQLKDLHDCLDDNQTYKSINRNVIIDDISLIKKLYKLMDDNDLLNENWDLIDALEKICL